MISYNINKKQDTQMGATHSVEVCIPGDGTSGTTMTYYQWDNEKPGLSGETDKEYIFYVLEGQGSIWVGDTKTEVSNGTFLYLPVKTSWKVESSPEQPLKHLLLTIPVNEESASQRNLKIVNDIMQGKVYEFGSNSTILVLDRSETDHCEVTVVSWPPHNRGAMVAHNDKEQTFFVLSGTGQVTVDGEPKEVHPGDIAFVPFNTPHTTEASDVTLTYLCMNSIVGGKKYTTFDEMYNKVAADRIKRWKAKDDTVGL
jgi:mannose-6-phosphate isomerase-like protein (cupin superfamily)